MNDLELITIGKITRNQGNRGEVRVIPLTDFPERYELLDRVYLVKGENILEKRIEGIRFHKKFVILKLDGINDIEEALNLRDYLVKIPESEALPLKEDEYYIDQLTGFRVITNKGESIGELAEVITTGGTDIFLVKGDKKEYMIPAAREIITEINEQTGEIIINPIPGLLEL